MVRDGQEQDSSEGAESDLGGDQFDDMIAVVGDGVEEVELGGSGRPASKKKRKNKQINIKPNNVGQS